MASLINNKSKNYIKEKLDMRKEFLEKKRVLKPNNTV